MNGDYLGVSVALNVVIGVLWVYNGAILSLMLDSSRWPRPARLSVFMLGTFAGLYRIDHALWTLGKPERSFLGTPVALIDNIFLTIGMGIFAYYLTKIFKGTGGARD